MSHRHSPLLTLGVACILTSVLPSCALAPAHTATPALPTQALIDPVASEAAWPAPKWWQAYGDDSLNLMVESALTLAPTLAAATARIEAAQAAAAVATAEKKPELSANASQQRQRLSDNGLFPPKLLGFNWYSTSELGVTVKYSPDFTGRRAALARASVATVAMKQAERAAIELDVAAAVVASYFDWQTYVSQLQIARAELESLQQEATVLQARERAGLARGDELQQLELSRLSMTDQLGNYEASRDASQAALAALLRQTPASLSTSAVHALPAVVASLPADASIDLMARRPDLKARRLQVDYAVANVEVARAGFLPDLNLSAVLGLSSLELGKLLEAGSAAPQLSAAIHLPLFDADKTRALHTQQRATLRAAVADYDGALISAAQEINTALATRAAAATQLRLRDEQLRAGEQLRQLAAARLDGGLTDQLPVLALDRRLLELRAARLTTQHAQLRVDLDLIRALGGGYGSN